MQAFSGFMIQEILCPRSGLYRCPIEEKFNKQTKKLLQWRLSGATAVFRIKRKLLHWEIYSFWRPLMGKLSLNVFFCAPQNASIIGGWPTHISWTYSMSELKLFAAVFLGGATTAKCKKWKATVKCPCFLRRAKCLQRWMTHSPTQAYSSHHLIVVWISQINSKYHFLT